MRRSAAVRPAAHSSVGAGFAMRALHVCIQHESMSALTVDILLQLRHIRRVTLSRSTDAGGTNQAAQGGSTEPHNKVEHNGEAA